MRKAYHFKVVRMLLLLVGAPVFVAASVFLLADRPHSPVVWIISGAGILFFGGALVVGVINAPRLIGNSEALILTPEKGGRTSSRGSGSPVFPNTASKATVSLRYTCTIPTGRSTGNGMYSTVL